MKLVQNFFDLGLGDTNETINIKKKSRKMGCSSCGLFHNCLSPKMEATGKGKEKILIVGEAPGRTEDEKGVQFVGQSGSLLEDTLLDLDLEFRTDCRITNAIRCRPTKNKTPSDTQIADCRNNLLKEINEFKPTVIIPLGNSAVQAVIGHRIGGRLTAISNSAFFSEQIPDQDLGCWVCPTYHPAYLLRNPDDKVLMQTWKNDLKKAIELAKNATEIKKIDLEKHCFYTTSNEIAKEWIEKAIKEAEIIAFDYETTGIKPHAKGHHIVSASISYDNKSYAFPFFYNDGFFLKEWKNLISSTKIKKIAHKADFENCWTYHRAGKYWIENLEWDTCIAAHCLNNKKPTGLKYLTYCKFGVIGYDDSVHKYITTANNTRDLFLGKEKKSNNSFNQIKEAPKDELLFYNAVDSYLTFKLYEQQEQQFDAHTQKGFKLFVKGIEQLAKIQQAGMKINVEQLQQSYTRLTKKIDIAEKTILQSNEAQLWKKKKLITLNFNSNQQLARLLYDLLEYELPETKGKTDIEALESIGTEFTVKILQHRKLKKIRDTYLSQYMREQVEGVLHPFFNLHKVRTFRSSSDSPNFQNVPKRDKQANQIIRSNIIPSPGNRLIEYDYKGIEVAIAACYNHDSELIKYILDPTTDMHRDIAIDLFFRDKQTYTKEERQSAKNGFVFPAFYGSNAFQIAPNIWGMIEDSTKQHLRKQGIKTQYDFKAHVEDIESKFWNERFQQYARWKLKTYQEYQKKGYVDLYTGFRCYGPMKYTEVTNYPIQGSAFHCLLWTLIRVNELIQEISRRSSIIGQIHDAIVVDAHPDDEVEIDNLIKLWGTKRIRKYWDWIIVPLKIEKESSEVDGSWDDMKEGGVL